MAAGRAAALTVFFQFLELRHKVELHNLTGRVLECPLDEMNRPRASVEPQLRIPPTEEEIEQLFAGWRQELVTSRKKPSRTFPRLQERAARRARRTRDVTRHRAPRRAVRAREETN